MRYLSDVLLYSFQNIHNCFKFFFLFERGSDHPPNPLPPPVCPRTLNQRKRYIHLHITFTLTWWLTGFSNPLSAVQRYVPEAVLLTFGKSQVWPRCSISLLLLSSNTWIHVMFGDGSPVASHNNCMFESSRTIWSRVTLVRLAATKRTCIYVILVALTGLRLSLIVAQVQGQVKFEPNSVY